MLYPSSSVLTLAAGYYHSQSAEVVLYVTLALLLGLAGLARGLSRRRARQAEAEIAEYDPARPLAAGGETVLHGKVEVEGELAVRVELLQNGREAKGKHGWTHTWTEERREVKARPFHLCLPGGRRVLVEPDQRRLLLADRLDVTERESRTVRRRIGQLSPGERVFVRGLLVPGGEGGGYRDAASEPKLVPPARGPMLISSEHLGERLEQRVRFHRRWAVAFLVFALAAVCFALPFAVRALAGEVVEARLSDRYIRTSRGKNGVSFAYHVKAVHGGDLLEVRVNGRDYDGFTVGAVTPFVRVPWWRSNHELGGRATPNTVPTTIGAVVVLVLALSYWLSARASLPWYLKRRLVESGKGKL